MIVTVKYTQDCAEHEGMAMTGQMIDCQRLYPLESDTHWGFMAYDHDDKLITEHKFPLSDGVKAYVMDNGRTVAVLPRN